MKFLTDENVASSVVKTLRSQGFDVMDVKEKQLKSISDTVLLSIANNRILITHDKDFIDINSFSKIQHSGIILLRLKNQSPSNVAAALLRILKSSLHSKISKNLTIISEEQITIHRRKKLL